MSSLSRREFLSAIAAASAAGMLPRIGTAADPYDLPFSGDLRILHFTDCHAQLLPLHFREPDTNLGIGPAFGKPPHLVGNAFLEHFGIAPGSREAYAFTCRDFATLAGQYGRLGGFAHLATLVRRLREQAGPGRSLLLDGGDTWQGSGTSLWTHGADMVEACNLLGVDVMTGHWEFTYGEEGVRENLEKLSAEFVAQNIFLTEEALFDEKPAHDEDTGHAFPPYTIREQAGHRIAVIGQAFPYTPVANPARFVPNWRYGVQERPLQTLVDQIRERHKPALVVLLSHNGMDVDLKLASRIRGLDAVFGGHTHDGVPRAIAVANPGGRTWVTNAGSNGKFLGVMDFRIRLGQHPEMQYRLLPVFSDLLPADEQMSQLIAKVRAPYLERLSEPLGVAQETLYRRGNFNGTFDELICAALLEHYDAEIAFSPGFRWGVSVLPGETITMDTLLTQTATTYPETYMNETSGEMIHAILEDVADNMFHEDPYRQQGGDMVRVRGLEYTLDPVAPVGQRIRDLRTALGPLDPKRNYKLTGWGVVGQVAPGPAIWDVVQGWLRRQDGAVGLETSTPRLVNVGKNPGIA